MSKKFKFTKARLEKLASSDKRTYYFDTGQKGLRLSITPAGSKTYQFQAWHSGKKKPVSRTIGKVGDISIREARKQAADLLLQVSAGADPEAARAEARAEKKLNEVFENYIADYAKGHKRTWLMDVKNYDRYFKKQLGGRKVKEIDQDIVRRWHTEIGTKNGHYAANRMIALLSSIFSNSLPGEINPCRGIKKFKEQSRDRFLNVEELGRFFESLDEEPEIFQDFFRLLLITGARKMNVLSMRWDEMQGNVWVIPAEKAKADQSINVPLLPQAMEILNRRKADCKGPFVFPGAGKTGHLVEPKSSWRRITKRAGLIDVRMHDLRRTMGSFQAATGANTAIIGKSLGHRSEKSTAIYTRLDLDPVRAAMGKAVDVMFGGE